MACIVGLPSLPSLRNRNAKNIRKTVYSKSKRIFRIIIRFWETRDKRQILDYINIAF